MSIGESEATAIAELSATFQGVAYSQTAVWMQLHTADPGGAGTANVASESTRVDVTSCFGTAPALAFAGAMQIANDAVIGPWTAVPATEEFTHATFWTASGGGSFIGSATVSGGSVTAGDNFEIPIGGCVITKPCAA